MKEVNKLVNSISTFFLQITEKKTIFATEISKVLQEIFMFQNKKTRVFNLDYKGNEKNSRDHGDRFLNDFTEFIQKPVPMISQYQERGEPKALQFA